MLKYCLILFAVLLAFPAAAQSEIEDDTEPPCTSDDAVTLTIEEITANFRELLGQCVMVRGLHVVDQGMIPGGLYVDRDAIAEWDGPRRGALGIRRPLMVDHPPHRPRWEVAIGRVGSCVIEHEAIAALIDQDDGRIYMARGYCHYTSDHFLRVEHFEAAEGPTLVRQRRPEISTELHDFIITPVETEEDHAAQQTAQEMLNALRTGDFESYLRLENPPLADDLANDALSEYGTEDLAESRETFDTISTVFRELTVADDNPYLLTVREFRNARLWCWLTPNSTQDDLPAFFYDADNDPGRPYNCVETGIYIFLRKRLPSASVNLIETGFPESAPE